MPGCERPWRESNTVCLHAGGMRGRCLPVEVTQYRGTLELGRGIASTVREVEGDDWRARTCGLVAWACEMAAKSTVGGLPEMRALISIRDSASATTLSNPRT